LLDFLSLLPGFTPKYLSSYAGAFMRGFIRLKSGLVRRKASAIDAARASFDDNFITTCSNRPYYRKLNELPLRNCGGWILIARRRA